MPAADELAEVFGLTGTSAARTTITPVARGAMGAMWRLEAGGRAYAAKQLFFDPPDPDRVAAEIALVDRARAEGVDSQVALAAPDGRYVVRAAGAFWRIYEWIDGEPPAAEDADGTDEWLVRAAARIHRAAVPVDPVAPYGPEDDWYHRVEVDWDAVVAMSAGRRWADRLTDAVPRIEQLTGFVNAVPVGPGIACHRDLGAGNVLRDRTGRAWLLDWDNHGPLEPWRELGALLLSAWPDPGLLTRLVTAYREENTIEIPEGPELFATGVAIWLNFLAGQIVEATADQVSAEQEAWSTAMIDRLLVRWPTLDDLAAAAAAAGIG